MKKHFTLKKIVLGLLVLLLVFQLFRIDKSNPPADASKDFIAVTQPPAEVAALLKAACYDCHSNQTLYPWYTNVAPVSWWIKDHINDGRRHLNFSTWTNYTEKKKEHKLEECVELVEENDMPLSSYTLIHSEAKLSPAQKTLLLDWFNTLRAKK